MLEGSGRCCNQETYVMCGAVQVALLECGSNNYNTGNYTWQNACPGRLNASRQWRLSALDDFTPFGSMKEKVCCASRQMMTVPGYATTHYWHEMKVSGKREKVLVIKNSALLF